MDDNNPTNCLVEVDVVDAFNKIFSAAIYAAVLMITCAVLCTSAIVGQLRQNRTLNASEAKRNTSELVSSISRTKLLEDVRNYAQDARANRETASTLVVQAKLKKDLPEIQ